MIEADRSGGRAEAFDVIELKDGRTFERYIQHQRAGGESGGMVVNFRDITARKRAEAELENVHRELLKTSGLAGMAEVASSVLHNVGNVLNSVNVSCSVISDKVRKSRIGSVAKAAELLRKHKGDLAAFFTVDPAGRKLPDYFGKLAEWLADEQGAVLKELQLLNQNIEHIKDIVGMQQNYSKVSGVTETLQISDLVEDALRMNASALTRHDVHIVREFMEVPPVTIEKHKVLQVLVNLMRNAKHACQELDRADRRLTVRVANGEGRIKIAVSDNGIGIPAKNLTRIFNHGFTTRKDGHGFGLHSGALAAREMGGSLTAHSDGAGSGRDVYTGTAFHHTGGLMNYLPAEKNRRILVIDDNRAIHDDFRKILAPGSTTGAALDKKPFDTVKALQLAQALTEKWWLHRQARRKMKELEGMVAERTGELQHINHALQTEVVEHQRAEKRLRESDEKFRQLAENITDVFWMTTPDMQEVLYASPAYEKLWGRTLKSLHADFLN